MTNVDALLSYLTPVSEPFLSNSGELFLKVDADIDHQERIASIKRLEPALRVSDSAALRAESSARLGDAAGWRIVGWLIAASVVVITVVTAVAVTIHNQDLSRLDAALVESLGGSRIGSGFGIIDQDPSIAVSWVCARSGRRDVRRGLYRR